MRTLGFASSCRRQTLHRCSILLRIIDAGRPEGGLQTGGASTSVASIMEPALPSPAVAHEEAKVGRKMLETAVISHVPDVGCVGCCRGAVTVGKVLLLALIQKMFLALHIH